jgi:HK97 family phage portal protein
MKLIDKTKAAVAAFRGKSAQTDLDSWRQLAEFLGIDPDTRSKSALAEATYFACLKVLSEAVGKLPLRMLQATESGGVRVLREHPFFRTLHDRPNRYMTASVFWSTMELCRNHFGNGYAWIDTRDPAHPQLWPMHPASVQVWYDNACLLSDAPDVYYRYQTPRGLAVLGSEEVLHFKSHMTLDGLVGVSVREQLAGTLKGNVEAQELLAKMYASGMTAKAVLQYTGDLKDKSVDALTAGIEAYAKGKLKDRGIENIIPMPVGMTLTPLNLKLADSQFLEIKQYSALQIAAAFGVKPYQVGDYTKSSYASAEAQQLSFLVDTLQYILKQYEEETEYKIILDADAKAGYNVKFNTGVMLRADQKTQIDTLSAAVSNFLLTPNEARERLDLPAKEGGDQLIGNGSTVPITAVGIQWQKNQAPTTPEEEDE